MEQKIDRLPPADADYLEAMRTWVRDHYTPEARAEYDTLEGKLRLLETILASGWIEPGEIIKQKCLGVTLGDALVQQLGMIWVMVEDEYGRDPAVCYEDRKVLAFAQTMIAKRIEAGEEIDIRQVFAKLCADIPDLRPRVDKLLLPAA